MTSNKLDTLKDRIEKGIFEIGVIGLGYVGLPLALTFVEKAKIKVLGFDIDENKVLKIQQGETYILHLDKERQKAAVDSGLLQVTSAFTRLSEPDVLIIAVPTPLTVQREPDLTYIRNTVETIGKYLRAGQLIILESTTYPGTTEELVKPILERTGLVCGQDFFLAFSPEREDPGNLKFSTSSIPKIVGGIGEEATRLAASVYSKAIDKVIRVSTVRVAEAAKITENVFRAVNIALVNELKVIYDKMGIDIWEVLDAASTKPFGFMRFNPGPGLGGHCIPLDPFYLAWKAHEFGIVTRFIELADEINISMPTYVISKLQGALNERCKPIKKSNILILGLAYKKNIDDPRESPSFELIYQLLKHGAIVSYHDPFIAIAPAMRSWKDLPVMNSVILTAESLKAFDAVIIVTDHDAVDYELVAKYSTLIIDTRGVYRAPRPNVVKA